MEEANAFVCSAACSAACLWLCSARGRPVCGAMQRMQERNQSRRPIQNARQGCYACKSTSQCDNSGGWLLFLPSGNCSDPMLALRLPKQKFSPSRPPAVCRRGGRQLMRGAARLAHLNTRHTFIHMLSRCLSCVLCTTTFLFPLPAHQAAQRTLCGPLTRRPCTEVCPHLLRILQIAMRTQANALHPTES